VHLNISEADPNKEACAEFNHLNINAGASVTDRLNVECRELAVATLLWSVVTEVGGNGDESYRLWRAAHTVLDVGAQDASGRLRSE
jgi:hypothetical protein